ncbi:unnamed protein product [Clonostachys rosea f. rosea IK726]|uniref:NADP-dependent oxidoreductase domain-containing protein n=2 Tax=Bionectria ochroleuca TaxID=29856 RepID=A0A0B7KJZ9_BIOOC|nr:unnamed protein product [Clonostachys rosea f. rosea IK726]
MHTANGLDVIFGAAGIGPEAFRDVAREQLDVLLAEDITALDTSEMYPGCEDELANLKVTNKFEIHAKVAGGASPGRQHDAIIEAGQERLRKLNVDQVEIFYLHAPDNSVPVSDQVKAYDALYKQGAFKHLGLCNFTPEELEEFYDAAKSNNCVLPTVYQGSYSAVSRVAEKELIPLLRKLGIRYVAYGPISGGLLAKSREELLKGTGRFDPNNFVGTVYNALFNKPSYLKALDAWGEIAEQAGISRAELAYRWIIFHSALSGAYGDGIIFSASSVAQLKNTIKFFKAGPLESDIVKRADAVWKIVEPEAPLDNWHGYMKGLF